MNNHSSAVGMPIYPAGSSESPVNEAVSLPRTNEFSHWCVAKLLQKMRRDHRVIVTTGASITLTPS
jgi:hypothetical protein